MATVTVTPGYNWVSGEVVTPAKMNLAATPTASASNIVDADIAGGAAIAASKLALAGAITDAELADGSVAQAKLADGSVTQAKLATGVAGNGPAFSAYANSTTTLPSNVDTKIILGGELFDTASCFASSRFTPNVAGYYQINASVLLSALTNPPGAEFFAALIYKNGILAAGGSHHNASDGRSSTVSALILLNGTTDYVELYARQGQAGAPSKTVLTSQRWTFLSGFLARAL